ncbi:hypothetical protein AOA61_18890 [Pseudomonas sp. 2995-1]|nr:hypothetical protein AOA61_18890 [Pseudomonas sp. 2995-1]
MPGEKDVAKAESHARSELYVIPGEVVIVRIPDSIDGAPKGRYKELSAKIAHQTPTISANGPTTFP